MRCFLPVTVCADGSRVVVRGAWENSRKHQNHTDSERASRRMTRPDQNQLCREQRKVDAAQFKQEPQETAYTAYRIRRYLLCALLGFQILYRGSDGPSPRARRFAESPVPRYLGCTYLGRRDGEHVRKGQREDVVCDLPGTMEYLGPQF